MSVNEVTRGIAVMAVFVACLNSGLAGAQPDREPCQRPGPPPEAFEACAGLTEGAECAFSGPRGDMTGSCIVPPDDDAELVCAPQGWPHRGRDERPERDDLSL